MKKDKKFISAGISTILLGIASGCNFSASEVLEGKLDRGLVVTKKGIQTQINAGPIRVALEENKAADGTNLILVQDKVRTSIALKVPLRAFNSDDIELDEKDTGTDFGIRSTIRRENIWKPYKTSRTCSCEAMVRFEEYLNWVRPRDGGPQWVEEFSEVRTVHGKYAFTLLDAEFIREKFKIELLKKGRVFSTFTASRDILDDSRVFASESILIPSVLSRRGTRDWMLIKNIGHS